MDLGQVSLKVKKLLAPLAYVEEQASPASGMAGFTEAADADLSDAEIRAPSRHRSAKVLPRYAKRTMKQMESGTKKRRAIQGGREKLTR